MPERAVVVGLFDSDDAARSALGAFQQAGLRAEQIAAEGQQDEHVSQALQRLGMGEGEARYLLKERQAGRSLVAVEAAGRTEEAEALLRQIGGHDVEGLGGALARSAGQADPGLTPPPSREVTLRWEDVRSRYEMLFGQRFGATDATWDQYEPVYRHGWALANDARYRGRSWSEVESDVAAAWGQAALGVTWQDAREAVADVWQDVADEAATGAEGGEQRRVARPSA